MKNLVIALSLVLISMTGYAKTAAPTAAAVVDALALANPADVAEFLKGGNRTTSINYKAVSANEEVFMMVRQNCSSNGLGPSQCLGGVEIRIELVAKISMANRYKVGTSSVSHLR